MNPVTLFLSSPCPLLLDKKFFCRYAYALYGPTQYPAVGSPCNLVGFPPNHFPFRLCAKIFSGKGIHCVATRNLLEQKTFAAFIRNAARFHRLPGGSKFAGNANCSELSVDATDEENLLEQGGYLPTMEDIVATAAQQSIKLEVSSFGPTFRIDVKSLDGKEIYGTAQGWVKLWTTGNILHLESVNLIRGTSKNVGNVFGAGFFVGACALRHGLDRGCRTAELLAILDDEVTHAKLVKYYGRLGFKTLYEVNEEEFKYFLHRVVWGGIGTRMDADCEELLRKWSKLLKPKSVEKKKKKSSKFRTLQ